ncbi:hypothetical protein JR316_0001759 [Psilocybe cubensis]|uniref:Uncharacterized protein n=1 Tax=Psilocybe cubensis TaxID=181762 RepID=A0ACB8HB22_PSICU|nr:hypothetical protein JR316_0001759 [Psilocybe cubensis]KAH9484857.1 hypothetical protein JR316_0001759 [Psilocybe cubensis]
MFPRTALFQYAHLDAEIYGVHDQLGELLKERRVNERQVNVGHNISIHRFPVDVMAIIFHFYDLLNERKPMTSPLVLGGVCERWRDITLQTPLLWDRVVVLPPRDSTELGLVKLWLDRSETVPLSLTVQHKHPSPTPCPPFEDLITLLRLHSSRWTTLKLIAPASVIHALLHNLENVPDVIRLRMDIPSNDRMESISMRKLLRPRTFHAKKTSIQQTFLAWDNLTRLDVAAIKMDELVHIIRCGKHLTECTAMYIAKHGRSFPLPSAPFVHKSLKYVKTTSSSNLSDFLRYLTLPSLRKLHYDFLWENAWTSVPALNAFLDRSSASPETFSFTFSLEPQHHQQVDWVTLRDLPRITHMVLDIEHNTRFDMTTALFSRLSDTADVYLPHLRALKITTPTMSQESWRHFHKFLGGIHNKHDDPNHPRSNIHNPFPIVSATSSLPNTITRKAQRPLESVIIHLKDRFTSDMARMMDPYLPYFLDVEKFGVSLKLVDSMDFDMLHRPPKVTAKG